MGSIELRHWFSNTTALCLFHCKQRQPDAAKDWNNSAYVGRQRGDTKNEVQLRDRMLILDAFRVGDIIAVGTEKGRSMQDWEQWRPFLKEDVDHLVRHKAWGNFDCRGTLERASGGIPSLPIGSEESLGLEVGAWFAAFLYFDLEGI